MSPPIIPSLHFDALNQPGLPPWLIYSLASGLTYFDRTGTMRTAPANFLPIESRYDAVNDIWVPVGRPLWDGATNDVYPSIPDISSTRWTTTTGTTLTVNYALSPDGTQNATRLQYDGSGTIASYRLYNTVSAASSAVRCTSIWMRTISGTATVRLDDNQGGSFTTCNLTTRWQRFTKKQTGNNSGAWQLLIYSAPGDNSALDILVWGGQLETNSAPTAYIPTTSVAVTRAAPLFRTVTVPYAYPGNWLARGAGGISIVVEVMTETTWVTGEHLTIGYSSGNFFELYSNATNNFYALNNRVASAYPVSIFYGTLSAGTPVKSAYRARTDDFSWYMNGAFANSDISTALWDLTGVSGSVNMYPGSYIGSSNRLGGWFRGVSVFFAGLNNAQLQSASVAVAS